jgi:CRP-like cAMP-binding protein
MKTEQQTANKILAALSPEEFEPLAAKLKSVPLLLGEILYLPDQKIEYVYFVNSGVVSLLSALENGATVEAGVIGSEGMAGISVILGADSTPNQALIQGAGEAWRIPSKDIRTEFGKGGKLRDLILRYTHTLFTQVAQTAACNRLHSIEQRLARWLLLTQDRVDRNDFVLTQDFLSRMLGVRRAGVSVAANTLRQAGLLDYHRGTMTILNRQGLEEYSCECYAIVKDEYDRHLSV